MAKRNRSNYFQRNAIIAALLLPLVSPAFSQESAYSDLNGCTKNEQMKSTAKGIAVGALSGFGAALLAGKKNDAGKAALAGAAVGGVAGFAIAYYSAIDTCYKINPSWIPESKLARDPSKSYQQVIKENQYKPADGVKVLIKQVDVPATVQAGSKLAINTTFDVMTPDGAQSAVVIERKLFVIDAGKDVPLPFPGGKGSEGQSSVVEAGRSTSSVQLPIAGDTKPGTVYRVDVSIASAGKAPDMVSRSFTVQ